MLRKRLRGLRNLLLLIAPPLSPTRAQVAALIILVEDEGSTSTIEGSKSGVLKKESEESAYNVEMIGSSTK